jgi:hypothetical protein
MQRKNTYSLKINIKEKVEPATLKQTSRFIKRAKNFRFVTTSNDIPRWHKHAKHSS